VSENKYTNMISLTGEIVSIYEKEGNRFAKVHFKNGFVDVTLQEEKELYLGDKVIIDSNLTITRVTHKSEEENIK
jgi:hypothetical protein